MDGQVCTMPTSHLAAVVTGHCAVKETLLCLLNVGNHWMVVMHVPSFSSYTRDSDTVLLEGHRGA